MKDQRFNSYDDFRKILNDSQKETSDSLVYLHSFQSGEVSGGEIVMNMDLKGLIYSVHLFENGKYTDIQ